MSWLLLRVETPLLSGRGKAVVARFSSELPKQVTRRMCLRTRARSPTAVVGARSEYPAPVLDESVIKSVLAEALAKGGEMAEIFVEDRRSSALRLEDSKVEDVASGRDAG